MQAYDEITIPKTAKEAEPTYYERLGISQTAGKAEIKGAYNKLALKYHPDKTKALDEEKRKKAEEKLNKVQESYNVLKDETLRKKYDAFLAASESKEGGSKDLFFTLTQPSISSAPASGEQRLVLREKISLSALMEQVGKIDKNDFVQMLKKADVETVVALLDTDEFSEKLYLISFTTVDFSPIIRHKILTEEKLYKQCSRYTIYCFAECSPEDCCIVLSSPVLNKNLNGEDLFNLAQKFSIKFENFDTNVQEKYEAYRDLFNYKYISGSDVEKEKEKIEFWIKKAQVEKSGITSEYFKNITVKKILGSNIYELDYMDLYGLANTDSILAEKIGNDPVLWRKFTRGAFGIFRLCCLAEKYLNVCLSVLQNSEIIKFLNAEKLFRLRECHLKETAVSAAIEKNFEANKRYKAYYQLLNYPSTETTVPDEKTEKYILALYREADVSDADDFVGNRTLAFVFLKYNLVFFKYKVIEKNPSLSYCFIENHVTFSHAFENSNFLAEMVNASEDICLEVLSAAHLAERLTGEQLNELSKKYGLTVLNKIMENTVLLDRYQAYKELRKLIQQPSIKVECEEKKFNPTASVSGDINKNYERAIFLQGQEKGHLAAFHYFDKAVKDGYEPAINGIKEFVGSIISSLKVYSSDEIRKKCLPIAEALLDPKNLYYDKKIAICFYEWISWFVSDVKVFYILGVHYAARYFDQIVSMSKGSYHPLLEACLADVNKRYKIRQEQKQPNETVSEDLSKEPAVQFVLEKIKTEPIEKQAERYIELFRFFFEKGYMGEAQSCLEKAINIDVTKLTAKDWACLGDSQKSEILTKNYVLENKAGSVLATKDEKKCNQPLTSFLNAIKKSIKEKETEIDFVAATSFLEILCDEGVNIIPSNVEVILSLPELLEKLEPKALYVILEKNPLIAPILPEICESKGLDGRGDYFDTLIVWAADNNKISSRLSTILETKDLKKRRIDLIAWISDKDKNLSKLSTLAEVFLNGRNGEQASYKKYAQKCLEEIIYMEEIAYKAPDASEKLEESKSVVSDADDTITRLVKKIEAQPDPTKTKKLTILSAIFQKKHWKDSIAEKETAEIEKNSPPEEDFDMSLPTKISVKTYHHRWLPNFAIIINFLLISTAVLLFFMYAQLFVPVLIALLVVDILFVGYKLSHDSMTVNEVHLDLSPLLEGRSTTSELLSSLPRNENNEDETDGQTLISISPEQPLASRQLVGENNKNEELRVVEVPSI